MPDRVGQSAKQFGGGSLARAECGPWGGARHAVAEHQFSIRATINKHGWNSHKGSPVTSDLTLKLDWVSSIDPFKRQPETRGIESKYVRGPIASLYLTG